MFKPSALGRSMLSRLSCFFPCQYTILTFSHRLTFCNPRLNLSLTRLPASIRNAFTDYRNRSLSSGRSFLNVSHFSIFSVMTACGQFDGYIGLLVKSKFCLKSQNDYWDIAAWGCLSHVKYIYRIVSFNDYTSRLYNSIWNHISDLCCLETTRCVTDGDLRNDSGGRALSKIAIIIHESAAEVGWMLQPLATQSFEHMLFRIYTVKPLTVVLSSYLP